MKRSYTEEIRWQQKITNVEMDRAYWPHLTYHYLLKYVELFYKYHSKIPASVMKNVYYAFVHCMYGIEVYDNTYTLLTLIN